MYLTREQTRVRKGCHFFGPPCMSFDVQCRKHENAKCNIVNTEPVKSKQTIQNQNANNTDMVRDTSGHRWLMLRHCQ